MYVRPPNYRYQSPMRVPENYSGNVFREPAVTEPSTASEPTVTEEEITNEKNNTSPKDESSENTDSAPKDRPALLEPRGFNLKLGSLFGSGSGIGTEELLIIALILLLSGRDSEECDDLILFLVLLFFIR